MANKLHQFGLLQIFLGMTAFGTALTAARSSDVTCYVLGAFSALLAGATVSEDSRHAGLVAFSVLVSIYFVRVAIG
ncbi:MAG: hypothetical protein H6822_27640 [Planctomycetaceae bacterium]|nr:hypothetical protein [Planctomycetales bacterium]MCB9925953.1 hypothetical protein [Planctomycetaceae bacterium]